MWVTTKDGRRVDTDWFDKERQIAQNRKQARHQTMLESGDFDDDDDWEEPNTDIDAPMTIRHPNSETSSMIDSKTIKGFEERLQRIENATKMTNLKTITKLRDDIEEEYRHKSFNPDIQRLLQRIEKILHEYT